MPETGASRLAQTDPPNGTVADSPKITAARIAPLDLTKRSPVSAWQIDRQITGSCRSRQRPPARWRPASHLGLCKPSGEDHMKLVKNVDRRLLLLPATSTGLEAGCRSGIPSRQGMSRSSRARVTA
jgi:hypothetical protein